LTQNVTKYSRNAIFKLYTDRRPWDIRGDIVGQVLILLLWPHEISQHMVFDSGASHDVNWIIVVDHLSTMRLHML